MKNILLEDVPDIVFNEKVPILNQLVQIVNKLNDLEIETQSLLLESSEKKFEIIFLEKVSTNIEIKKLYLCYQVGEARKNSYIILSKVLIYNILG